MWSFLFTKLDTSRSSNDQLQLGLLFRSEKPIVIIFNQRIKPIGSFLQPFIILFKPGLTIKQKTIFLIVCSRICSYFLSVIRVAGENRFVIAPRPGGHFTHAGAKYDSVYGMVESRWEKKDGKTVYTIRVPSNCEAKVILPGGIRETVTAGEYCFEE